MFNSIHGRKKKMIVFTIDHVSNYWKTIGASHDIQYKVYHNHGVKYGNFTPFPGVKICEMAQFPHQKIRWNFGVFRSELSLNHSMAAVDKYEYSNDS